MQLSETRILITGGASGIGHFVTTGLLPLVKTVIVIDKDTDSLKSLPDAGNLIKLTCDVSNPEEVNNTLKLIFEKHDGVNACLNNAGIIHSEPLFNLMGKENKKHSIDNWKKVIDINLNGVFYIASNLAEQMIAKKEKGVIINISSISAQGNMGQSAYSASKAAVEALTKTWSKELGMFKIRCACIAPGFFDTPSTRKSLSEAMVQKWEKAVPLGKMGSLEDLLSAVKFIIENDYYNGKVLALDGGLTI
jgi:3-oxoacyl-[acyl-carrier protein] reductase